MGKSKKGKGKGKGKADPYASYKEDKAKMRRGSTFQKWDKYESGPVVHIPVEEFLKSRPDYECEYTTLYNAIRTKGAVMKDGVWEYKGKYFKNVKECFQCIEVFG